MGWLYMRTLERHSGPRQYLDAQFSYENAQVKSTVLKSALVKMRVYYAAVEHVVAETGAREVFAAVCLVDYNLRDREGFIFGYKDMDETVGPCECDCPQSILDLLTPTDVEYAKEWRANCRKNIKERRAQAKKPKPRPGQTIIFDHPIHFSDGRNLDRLLVVRSPRGRRTVVYQDPVGYSLYRISNIKSLAYRLDPPA